MFPIKNRKPNNGCTGKENVVTLIENIVVNCCAAEKAVPAKHPDRYNVKYILVEHVRYKIRVATIRFSTVTEK